MDEPPAFHPLVLFMDPADKQQFAHFQGLNIAKQIQDMNKNFSNDYFFQEK